LTGSKAGIIPNHASRLAFILTHLKGIAMKDDDFTHPVTLADRIKPTAVMAWQQAEAEKNCEVTA